MKTWIEDFVFGSLVAAALVIVLPVVCIVGMVRDVRERKEN